MLKLIQRTRKSNRTVALANELKYMFQLSSQVTKRDLKAWLETNCNIRVRSICILKPYKRARRSHRYQRLKIAIVAVSPIIRKVTDLNVRYRIDTLPPALDFHALSPSQRPAALTLTTSKPIEGLQFVVGQSVWPYLKKEWTHASAKFEHQTSLPSFVQQQSVLDTLTQWLRPGMSQLMAFVQTIGHRLLPTWVPGPSAGSVVSTWRESFEMATTQTWSFPWQWVGDLRWYWLAQWKMQKVAEAESKRKTAEAVAKRKAEQAKAKQEAAEVEQKQKTAEAEARKKAAEAEAQKKTDEATLQLQSPTTEIQPNSNTPINEHLQQPQQKDKQIKRSRGFGVQKPNELVQRVKKTAKHPLKTVASQHRKTFVRRTHRVPVYVSPFGKSWMRTMWPVWKQGLIVFHSEAHRHQDNIIG